ncbi:MAG: sigma 54-interacting transcriptional regulator [Myxococcota bacterium]
MLEMRLELFNFDRRVLLRDIDGQLFLVGSNPQCHLCIPDPDVAGIQCLMRREGSALYLANRAADGTRVGNEAVMDEVRLADGDRISLGELHAVVRFVESDDEHGSGTRTLIPRRPSDAHAYQLVRQDDGERWLLGEDGLTLGTEGSNDIVLVDDYASSNHARITHVDGRVMVQDLDSRNGVFVDGAKIGMAEVRDGATLQLGTSKLRVERVLGEEQKLSLIQKQVLGRWVGRSPVSERVRTLIARLSTLEQPILVTGETGTGKEVTAQILHGAGTRAESPFVALNCGALTASLIESALFGHEKGAFTGASSRKKGAFQSAHLGTLFLDEVGELPSDLQPQLLRVLETGEVRRVGSSEVERVDVRVIAATNRDLEAEVLAGRFREDLFHRLAVLGVQLPALRDRAADIAELARHFIQQVLPRGQEVMLDPDAVNKLETHTWAGNVRELRNVIQRAVLMRKSDVLGPDDIHFSLSTLGELVNARSQLTSRRLAEVERSAIIEELVRQRGNRSEAATILGISRSTLHRKIADYEIEVESLVRDRAEPDDLHVSRKRKGPKG